MKFTIGTDPEFFLLDSVTNKYVSAHDKVPGNKKEPSKLPGGGAVQADGTAVEFNTPPTDSPKEFKEHVLSALNDIRKIIPSRYTFCFEPVVLYDAVTWKKIPKEAKELGCDPDWYIPFGETKLVMSQVNDPGLMRTGSGHIHFGWTSGEDTSPESSHFDDCVYFIQNMNYYYRYGFENYYLDGSDIYYDEARRRQYYGEYTSFRCKPYGVEMRYPSNTWLNNPNNYELMAQELLRVAEDAAHGVVTDGRVKSIHKIEKYSRLTM